MIPLAGLLSIGLSDCSQKSKDEMSMPSNRIVTQPDFSVTLPEVTVTATAVQVTYNEIPQILYGSGGGGGGGGDTGGPPVPGPNEPMEPLEPIKPLQAVVISAALTPTMSLRIALDVQNGTINNVSSYVSGLTVGTAYNQVLWSNGSVVNGVYTVQVVWYVTYSLFIDGIGTIANGQPLISTVVWDSNAGSSSITTKVVR